MNIIEDLLHMSVKIFNPTELQAKMIMIENAMQCALYHNEKEATMTKIEFSDLQSG